VIRRLDLIWVVLAIAATVLGIWLGVAGAKHLAHLHRSPERRRGRGTGPMTIQEAPSRLVAGRSAARDAADAVLVVLGAGAAFVALWPLLVMLSKGVPLDPVALVAHASGMLGRIRRPGHAGPHVALAPVGARHRRRRPRQLPRPRRPHHFSLALVHVLSAVLTWSLLTSQDPISALAQVLTWPGLLTATTGTALMCAVAMASARSARRKMRWETWYSLHLSMYLAVALSFTHQLSGPDLAGRLWLQVAWALLYAFTFTLVLRYRFIAPAMAALRHRLRVVAVIPEAPGVVHRHPGQPPGRAAGPARAVHPLALLHRRLLDPPRTPSPCRHHRSATASG
jgi:hypothetical protein